MRKRMTDKLRKEKYFAKVIVSHERTYENQYKLIPPDHPAVIDFQGLDPYNQYDPPQQKNYQNYQNTQQARALGEYPLDIRPELGDTGHPIFSEEDEEDE